MSKKFFQVLTISVLSVILSGSFCKAASPPPDLPGCTHISIDADQITANCPIGAGSIDPNLQNKYVTSTSKWPCESGVPIKNCKGLLACTTDCASAPVLPTGSYLSGCENIKFGLHKVSADCLVGAGGTNPTGKRITSTLNLPCGVSEISNCEGVLTCGPCLTSLE